jgi:hypothetical protein
VRIEWRGLQPAGFVFGGMKRLLGFEIARTKFRRLIRLQSKLSRFSFREKRGISLRFNLEKTKRKRDSSLRSERQNGVLRLLRDFLYLRLELGVYEDHAFEV